MDRTKSTTGAGRSLLEHARRGLGRLPECGSHPGWPFFWLMIAMIFAVLADADALTAVRLLTAGAFIVLYLFLLLIGAVSRSRNEDRLAAKTAGEN